MTTTAVVTAIDAPGADVARVRLRLAADVPRLAGQYLEILDGDAAYAFSIASAPASGRDLELHVRFGADNPSSLAVMALLREALAAGRALSLRLPLGDCVLADEPDLPLLLVAGSTGFAQAKAMVEQAIAAGWPTPVTLCWGARTRADLYLHELPERWARERPGFRYLPVLSDAAAGDDLPRGLVHEAALQALQDPARVQVVACGSPAMVYATLDALLARGVPRERIASDVFAWAPRPEAPG